METIGGLPLVYVPTFEDLNDELNTPDYRNVEVGDRIAVVVGENNDNDNIGIYTVMKCAEFDRTANVADSEFALMGGPDPDTGSGSESDTERDSMMSTGSEDTLTPSRPRTPPPRDAARPAPVTPTRGGKYRTSKKKRTRKKRVRNRGKTRRKIR